MPKNNIWLVFGLSGAGKLTFAQFVADKLSWLHIEIDQKGDGPLEIVDHPELMQAYIDFARTLDASSLIRNARKQYISSDISGAIISFRSVDLIPPAAIRQNQAHGATIFYLVADAKHCLRSFLKREQASEHPRTWQHWIANNANQLALLAEPAMDAHTITSMAPDGLRKSNETIYQDVLRNIELPPVA